MIDEAVTSVDLLASLLWGHYYNNQQVLHHPSPGRYLLFSVQQTGTGCLGGSRSEHSQHNHNTQQIQGSAKKTPHPYKNLIIFRII